MAKTSMICPFSRKLCVECELYRGKHYFLCYAAKYRGNLGQPKEQVKASITTPTIDFQTLEKLVNPWTMKEHYPEDKPGIKIKVADIENKSERVCLLEEARTWDWNDPKIMRVIDGRHITGWHNLMEIVHYKSEKGSQEVEIHEGPRFILLSGG